MSEIYQITNLKFISLNKILLLFILTFLSCGTPDENDISIIKELNSGKIYFSGDTAYGPMFSEIGEKFGPFDLSIISIGAYKPRGMMQASHCTPEEAVEITSMLTSKNILGMHWGTIRLSAEDPWEPPIKFKKAAQLKGYHENQIWQLSIGETRSL